MVKYQPTEAELLETKFIQYPNNILKHMWYCKINPLNPAPHSIIFNSRTNMFRYSRFHYRIENIEELQTLIKLLSKGK